MPLEGQTDNLLLTPRLPQHINTPFKPSTDFKELLYEYFTVLTPSRIYHNLIRTGEGRLVTFTTCVAVASVACVYTINAPHGKGAAWICCAMWTILFFVYIVYRKGQDTGKWCMKEYRGADGCIRCGKDLLKVWCWVVLDGTEGMPSCERRLGWLDG